MEMKKRITFWLVGEKYQPIIKHLESMELREQSREIRRMLLVAYEAEHGGTPKALVNTSKTVEIKHPEVSIKADLEMSEPENVNVRAKLEQMDELF